MKIYIIPMVFISPWITMSCNSWFSIWMMMELNLMSFVPMIIYFNKFYKNLSMKYFLIQSISSSMLILSASNSLTNMNIMYFSFNTLLNLSLFIKLGTPPFQSWFINLMKNMNWINCLILSTWQKIIPLSMLIYIMNMSMMIFMILTSCILSIVLSLNHQSLRIILSYSSINHMSWLLMNLMISEMLLIMYFFSYMIINSSIMYMFHLFKMFYMNQIMNINNFKFNKMFLLFNFISMSGLPPFIGFIMKWLTLYYLLNNMFFMLNMIMLFMSIITFLFYTRIMISFLILNTYKSKLILINKFFINKNYLLIYFFTSFNLNLGMISIWMM